MNIIGELGERTIHYENGKKTVTRKKKKKKRFYSKFIHSAKKKNIL